VRFCLSVEASTDRRMPPTSAAAGPARRALARVLLGVGQTGERFARHRHGERLTRGRRPLGRDEAASTLSCMRAATATRSASAASASAAAA
jgi:hypothetical protein